MDIKLKPFIKWPGGKGKEIKIINKYIPKIKGRYIEPFVGGGAVFFHMGVNQEKVINDKSDELMLLYKLIKERDDKFFNILYSINNVWSEIKKFSISNFSKLESIYIDYRNNEINKSLMKELISNYVMENKSCIDKFAINTFNIKKDNLLKEMDKNLKRKFEKTKKLEEKKGKLCSKDLYDTIEASKKSAFYMYVRHIYNNIEKYNIDKSTEGAIFYFIREYCYSAMFRYNKSGGFNVPYGGISYNKKQLETKVKLIENTSYREYLRDTDLNCLDFEEFFEKIKPTQDDFIFLDPPYDSDFNTYAKMTFSKKDQVRLLESIKKLDSKFLMVIKNTEFIYELYKEYDITSFDKNYSVSFKNRNDREVEHLLIKNY